MWKFLLEGIKVILQYQHGDSPSRFFIWQNDCCIYWKKKKFSAVSHCFHSHNCCGCVLKKFLLQVWKNPGFWWAAGEQRHWFIGEHKCCRIQKLVYSSVSGLMSPVSLAGLVSPIKHMVSKLGEFQSETNVKIEELVLALCFYRLCLCCNCVRNRNAKLTAGNRWRVMNGGIVLDMPGKGKMKAVWLGGSVVLITQLT